MQEFLGSRITQISRFINKITEYDKVLQARTLIDEADARLLASRGELKSAKQKFEIVSENRTKHQQDLNALLHRKPHWGVAELDKFTELARAEHQIEQEEMETKRKLFELEEKVEVSHGSYLSALREYYRGEQLWSEKNRRLNTYATWSIILFNSFIVTLSITVIEPGKRESIAKRVVDINWSQIQSEFALVSKETSKRLDNIELALEKPPVLETPTIVNRTCSRCEKASDVNKDSKTLVREWLPVIACGVLLLVSMISK